MMTLITGGSGSGKSAFAENCVQAQGEARRIYIATMFPYDKESYGRIDRHRTMRAGKGFETVEWYLGLRELTVPEGSQVLLECMSNLTANEMFLENGAGDGPWKRSVREWKACVRRLLICALSPTKFFLRQQPMKERPEVSKISR